MAEPLPEPSASTFSPSDVALRTIESLDAERIKDEEYFAKTLRQLGERDDVTARDLTDSFILMQRRIRWGFNGTVWLPPNMGYVDLHWLRADTFLHYKELLTDSNLNVDELIDLANQAAQTDSMRSANALLLAAIFDTAKTNTLLARFLEDVELAKCQVPPLILHYLSFAIILNASEPMTIQFGQLIERIPLEESREDIICSVGYRQLSPVATGLIKSHVRSSIQKGFDQSGQTGLIVLRRRMKPQDYESYFQRLVPLAAKEHREDLKIFRTGEPTRGGMGKPPGTSDGASTWMIKAWDGFRANIYDDGARIEWGDTFTDNFQY